MLTSVCEPVDAGSDPLKCVVALPRTGSEVKANEPPHRRSCVVTELSPVESVHPLVLL